MPRVAFSLCNLGQAFFFYSHHWPNILQAELIGPCMGLICMKFTHLIFFSLGRIVSVSQGGVTSYLAVDWQFCKKQPGGDVDYVNH